MNALGFAWRSLARQPARASLGVIGVAAVAALLFDMLLLSNGLVVSMRGLFDRAGFDVRVTASDALPGQGPRLAGAASRTAAIARLPSVRSVVAIRLANAVLQKTAPQTPGGRGLYTSFQGAAGTGAHPWTLQRGSDLGPTADLVVNENTARRAGIEPGDHVLLRASCSGDDEALPPMPFTVSGVVEFPFDTPNGTTIATSLEKLAAACGGNERDTADMLLVAAREGVAPDVVATEVGRVVPDLRAFSNEQIVSRLERGGFTYFRQISTVLTAVTLSFAVLLITVLLTVSVNQRLGEIAALRALGFSRWRVVADVLCESALIVGGGGLLSLPLGGLLAAGLDRILKRIPGIPADVHFFVFEARALRVHAVLLIATAIVAALYPVRIVARLPIAATLRDEVVG